jgi:hypothetical protein
MGFFKLHQPREFKHRFIYYDPKKEAQKEREKQMAQSEEGSAGFKPSLHRGSFREQAEKSTHSRRRQSRSSNIRVLIIIALLLALMYFLLR